MASLEDFGSSVMGAMDEAGHLSAPEGKLVDYDEAGRQLLRRLHLDPAGKRHQPLDAVYAHPQTGAQVFVGGAQAACKRKLLDERGIAHVVNCQGVCSRNFFEDDFTYLRFPVENWRSHLALPRTVASVPRLRPVSEVLAMLEPHGDLQAVREACAVVVVALVSWRAESATDSIFPRLPLRCGQACVLLNAQAHRIRLLERASEACAHSRRAARSPTVAIRCRVALA